MPKTKLYTVGYEGRTPAELVRLLQEQGVSRLVDVRETPHSRVKGFSLMALFERLRKAGIVYEHQRDLGNPPEIRALFHENEIGRGRKKYRSLLENGRSASVDLVVGLARTAPTALLCRERDASACHRLVVAELAAERGEFELVHL